jgi:uncharacterized protein YjbJ (UPF0337 family)
LSFPWIGLDRSGTTVRRITPPAPAGASERVACQILPTSKTMRRNQMGQSKKDEIKGNMREAEGAVKERAGQVTKVPSVAAKGKSEKLEGRAQKQGGTS